jgi:glycosyltransferase involved in cell wall biosynthesis
VKLMDALLQSWAPVHVLTPVFNDQQALRQLLTDLDAVGERNGLSFSVVVVDDASSPPVRVAREQAERLRHIHEVRVVRLHCNTGHQRAIAIGLAYLAEHGDVKLLAIMDADGEDRPMDILHLVKNLQQRGTPVAVAARSKRHEPFGFRAGYLLFKLAYRMLTGHRLVFGNFALMTGEALRAIVTRSELWNNFPATLVRSRIGYTPVSIERGKRYCGVSKMSFVSLLLHGLTSISVFGDIALVRVLLFAGTIMGLSAAAIVVVSAIRFFTTLAIPGWASATVGSLSILGLQSCLFIVSLIFILLSAKAQQQTIPLKAYAEYIQSVEGARGSAGP